MKRIIIPALLALLCVCAPLSCLSAKARDATLVPALQTAWPGVRADVEVGIEDAHLQDPAPVHQIVEDLQGAIEHGDQVALSIAPWGVLAPYGERGVSARVARKEISSLVAQSLLERLRNFGDAINKLRIQ